MRYYYYRMGKQKNLTDRYMPKSEAVDYSGLGPRTLDRLVKDGKLTVFRPLISGSHNRKSLFKKSDLDALMESFR